jgi:protocatechuate 3,4-dioxygenase beta subunit
VRRTLLILAFVTLVLVTTPAKALAWFNGPDNGNGFGTHDWILTEALNLAQPSWVDTTTALLATDDPDTLYGDADRVNHFFLASGSYRGGPETINVHYRSALAAYAAGDYVRASHHLGVLSHYVADLCVPFHTRIGAQDSAMHFQYEAQVNEMTSAPGLNAHWITPWSRTIVDDVRGRAIDAALTSRSMYPDLEAQYRIDGFNLTVEMTTRAALTRAVNDLADIIMTIPTGAGSPLPVRLSTSVPHRYPAATGPITTSVKVIDPAGKPVEGVRVAFDWAYPNGPDGGFAFSDTNGIARASADGARLVVGRKVTVETNAKDANPAGIASSSSSTWFIPTDEIGYFKSSVSNRYPAQRTPVTVEALCLSKEGRPVAGLPVTFSWRHKTTIITTRATTDTDGVARSTRNIGGSAKGYRVAVDAAVTGGGTTRVDSTWFRPADTIAVMESTITTFTPLRNSRVTVSTTCLDSSGNPLPGVKVTFAWKFRTATYLHNATTDWRGVARVSRNIGRATLDYPVHITSTAPSGGSSRTSMTWFVPQAPPPPSLPETSTSPSVP